MHLDLHLQRSKRNDRLVALGSDHDACQSAKHAGGMAHLIANFDQWSFRLRSPTPLCLAQGIQLPIGDDRKASVIAE